MVFCGDAPLPLVTEGQAVIYFASLAACKEAYCNLDDLFFVLFAMSFLDTRLTRIFLYANSVTYNYCCHACIVTLSFMDTLIALTYSYLLLLTHCLILLSPYAAMSRDPQHTGCVYWRTIVCVGQHWCTCLTACGRHQRSSLIDVSAALLTPRHYRCRRLVELPSTTAPFRWLQRMHGTVCH